MSSRNKLMFWATRLHVIASLALVLSGFLSSCAKKETVQTTTVDSANLKVAADSGRGESPEKEEITLSTKAKSIAGIETVTLSGEAMKGTVNAPARIVPSQAGEAHVGATVSGRITKLYVREGTVVRQGAPLAEIESFDLSEIKSEYLKAHAEVLRTEKRLARQRQLSEEKLGAKRELEDAESDHAQAVARRSAAATKLRALGINPDQIESAGATSTTIRSPISGIVSKRLAGIGDFAEPNKDIFEVLNLSTVWADAQVPAVTAGTLRVGGSGYFQTQDGHSTNGRIIFVAPSADPVSHAVTVRLELPNKTNTLKPESFGTAFFETDNVRGLGFTVPEQALEKEGEEYYIYKQINDSTFQRVAVTVISLSNERATVTAELQSGDNIVYKGIFYLKSARQKDALHDKD